MSRSSIPTKRSADAQEAAWVADEDRFVLQQEKRKAVIRVKSGRAEPIDWLTVTLILIDPQNNQVGDEIEDDEFELVDPETLFRDLDKEQVKSLGRRIDTYVGLERVRSNREYWSMMKTICDDRSRSLQEGQQSARGIGSVSSDIDRILGPKSLEQLEKLETQIKAKLASDQAIDTDYWEHLLNNLLTYKARAKLGSLSQSVTSARLKALRAQQVSGAAMLRSQIEARTSSGTDQTDMQGSKSALNTRSLDPEPMLRLKQEDKSLISLSEKEFTDQIADDRRNVLRKGYFSYHSSHGGASTLGLQEPVSKRARTDGGEANQSSLTNYDREVARGLGENEELFTREEEVETRNRSQWADIYRPRKPKYFNRVHLGYEWNKYNQTHYDHDNPPPKVVQGYRFNIFYPDLVDKTKAPTYRIERENGRRRGQTLAPAGEDDTCLIRFTAGPPYEDIAFRIVDKEWDYSAKRDRGFRSSFDKGVLQLYFQLKKIYYRK